MSTSLRSFELERDERNIGVHEVLCRQLLELLDKEHQAYVRKKGLNTAGMDGGECGEYWSRSFDRVVNARWGRKLLTAQAGADLSGAVKAS